MPKEVKIVTFINDREGREQGEDELTRLVNEGYTILTSGGGTGADMVWGFVVLERETDEIRDTKTLLQIAMEANEEAEAEAAKDAAAEAETKEAPQIKADKDATTKADSSTS